MVRRNEKSAAQESLLDVRPSNPNVKPLPAPDRMANGKKMLAWHKAGRDSYTLGYGTMLCLICSSTTRNPVYTRELYCPTCDIIHKRK